MLPVDWEYFAFMTKKTGAKIDKILIFNLFIYKDTYKTLI
jgi:hypothetical protein